MNNSYRHALHFTFGALVLSLAVPSSAVVDQYALSMQIIQEHLRAGRTDKAETALQRLDQRFPRNTEITAMRMRLACQRQDFAAAHLFQPANIKGAVLRDAVLFCITEQRYQEAQALLDSGAADRAITILLPLMEQDKEGYRAGRMLANAYVINHEPTQAEALYDALADRYPSDSVDLKQQSQRLRNDRAFNSVQASLAAGDQPAAITAAKSIYASGEDTYRIGLLLAKTYFDDRQFDAAATIYQSLATQFPSDKDLSQLARQAHEMSELSTAKSLLDRGENTAAVAYLEERYPMFLDRYQGGILLQQAYRLTAKKSKAAEVSATLGREYPADTSLLPLAVTANLAAAEYDTAASIYTTLSPSQRIQVLTDLNGNSDRLSRRSIAITGSFGSSDGQRGDDEASGIRLKLASHIGTVNTSATRVRRFGQYATEIGVGLATDIGNSGGVEISVTHGSGAGFIPRESITLALSHSLNLLDLYGSVRHLIYSTTVADVLYAGFGKHISTQATLRAGIFYVPQSSAYSFLAGADWIDDVGDKTFATITAGRAGEQTGFRDTILRTASYSAQLGRRLNFSNQTSILGSVNYEHRAGLFNRFALNLELIKGW